MPDEPIMQADIGRGGGEILITNLIQHRKQQMTNSGQREEEQGSREQ